MLLLSKETELLESALVIGVDASEQPPVVMPIIGERFSVPITSRRLYPPQEERSRKRHDNPCCNTHWIDNLSEHGRHDGTRRPGALGCRPERHLENVPFEIEKSAGNRRE